MSRSTTPDLEIQRFLAGPRSQKLFYMQKNTGQDGKSKGVIKIYGKTIVFQFLYV